MALIRSLAVGALFALAGCATTGAPAAAPSPSAAASAAGDPADIRTLPPQPLDPGQCGLFLWAQSPQERPKLVLAAFDKPAQARVQLGARQITLPRTGAEGELNHGHFARQTYSDGRQTLTVDVEFDPKRELRDGAVVDRGALKFRDEHGWETVTSVRGLTACQR